MKGNSFISSEKDKKYWKILNSCIRLEIKMGHLKWTIAQLHRESKISRSLIYYYFGRSKNNIVLEACHYFGVLLAGTDKHKMNLYEQNNISDALIESKNLIKLSPDLICFYFMHRFSNSEVGEIIRRYEKEGIKKRKNYLKTLNDTDAEALFALQMGISLCSQIDSLKKIQHCLNLINLEHVLK